MDEMRRVIRGQHEQSLVMLNYIARRQRIDFKTQKRKLNE